MGVKRRFFILISIFFALIIAVVGTIIINLSNYLLLKEYKKLTEDNLSYVLEITNRELAQLEKTLEFIARDSNVQKRVNEQYQTPIQKIMDDRKVDEMMFSVTMWNLYNYLNALYIEGSSDHYLYKMSSQFMDQSKVEQVLAREGIWTNSLTYLGIGNTIKTDEGHMQVLKFSRSLISTDFEMKGKVYFELSVNYLKDILNSQRRNIDIRMTLVDEQNLVLFDKDLENIGKPYEYDPDLDIVMESHVEQFGWKIICQTVNTVSYDEHHEVLLTMLIMFIVLLIILGIWIKVFMSRLIGPIAELSKGMRRVRNGDYSIRLKRKSNDELGQLADNFNAMVIKYEENVANEVETAKKLKDAEYKTLQAQINPHFMYNALNAIKYIASVQNLNNISSLINDLWVLLKNASRISGQFVTLEKEIEVIQAYVRIQEVRYKGKFEVVFDLDEVIMNLVLPKYILQPFVENAIFHGIAPKKGLGIIEIKGYKENDELVIVIKDDGIGMSEELVHKIMNGDEQDLELQHKGMNNIGVKNVDERMKLLFGEEYGVMIQSEIGVGTEVTLRFPNKF